MNVAVVIPCRNEEKYIGKCIDSVLHSDYKTGKLEIFVCDGLSDDRTREIVQSYSEKNPDVKLIDNQKRTTPFALNLGIRAANDADVVIILGAHAEVDANYVRYCVEDLQKDASLGCAGGLLENVNEDSTSNTIAKAMSSPFGVGSAHFRTGAKDGYVDTVAFGAYRKTVFEKVGLFDEALTRNQDDEFNFRVTKAGFRIWLDTRTRCRYYVRASYSKLYRQYFQYGYWKVYVNRKHGEVTSVRQLVPPAFVLFLFAMGAAIFWKELFIAWCCLAFGYLVSAFFFALKSGGSVPGVVLGFFLMHFSYGLGYLKGIAHFLIFKKQPAVSAGKLSR